MRLYAFWNYDQYPYVLGAEVEELKGEWVKPKGYAGFTFKHIYITDYDYGMSIKNKLNSLGTEYHKARAELNKSYIEKANDIAPFIKIKN